MVARLSSLAGVVLSAVVLLAWMSGVKLSNVGSGSMKPLIPTSSAVMTVPASGKEVQVDGVYVYQSHNRQIVHRVISRQGEDLLFRGDANVTTDPPVDPGQVTDRVVASLPRVGKLAHELWQVAPVVALLAGTGMVFSLRRQR